MTQQATPPSAPTTTDEQLVNRTVAALDSNAESLDYAAQLKLQRARAEALAALTPAGAPRRSHVRLLWLTAVPAALAVLLLVPLTRQGWDGAPAEPESAEYGAVSHTGEALQGFEDMELLAADADLDTLADMEFYQWLAEHPDASDA